MLTLRVIIAISIAALFLLVFLMTIPSALHQNKTEIKHEEWQLPCKKWQSVILHDAKTSSNGTITSEGVTYEANETIKDGAKYWACACVRNACLRKCCPLDQSYELVTVNDISDVKCVNVDGKNLTRQLDYYEYNNTVGIPKKIGPQNLTVVSHELMPYCKNKDIMLHDSGFFMLANGSVLITPNDEKKYDFFSIDHYCIDYVDRNISVVHCVYY